MYPDLYDVQGSAQRIGISIEPRDVFVDVVLASEFLRFADHRCHAHGKHEFVSAKALKELIAEYTERFPTDLTVLLALRFLNVKTRPSKLNAKKFGESFESLTIKFPPLDRLPEFADEWRKLQALTEQEIEGELQQKRFQI